MRAWLLDYIVVPAVVIVSALVAWSLFSGCAHGNLDVARALRDRDGGQWLIEYDNDGDQTRCACAHQRR